MPTPLTLAPAATLVDWTIARGETYDIHVPVLDATGGAVTVTGWTPVAQVRRSSTEPLLHEWSAANSNIACVGTEVVLNVVASATSAWAWTDAQVSVLVTDLVGKPHLIAYGAVHSVPAITHTP